VRAWLSCCAALALVLGAACGTSGGSGARGTPDGSVADGGARGDDGSSGGDGQADMDPADSSCASRADASDGGCGGNGEPCCPSFCDGGLPCRVCNAPDTCGGGDTPGMCGCTQTTCGAAGAMCGHPPDGCGCTLDCGSCSGHDTCGGGGQPYHCGCTPVSCTSPVLPCGATTDGCGNPLNCPACPSGYTCVNGRCDCEAGVTSFYRDMDGDGYGAGAAMVACSAPAGYVANNTDCCDSDAGAHPGASGWFTSADACGSFDWNCDGVVSYEYDTTVAKLGNGGNCSAACANSGTLGGWEGGWASSPSCGSAQTWYSFCWNSCQPGCCEAFPVVGQDQGFNECCVMSAGTHTMGCH